MENIIIRKHILLIIIVMLRDVLVIGIIFIAMFLILHYTKDKKEAFLSGATVLSGADRLHADFIEQY